MSSSLSCSADTKAEGGQVGQRRKVCSVHNATGQAGQPSVGYETSR